MLYCRSFRDVALIMHFFISFVIVRTILHSTIPDFIVFMMKNLHFFSFTQYIVVTTLISIISQNIAHADEVHFNTIIPYAPKVNAASYIVIDHNSGKILAELNADVHRDPASLTKMMTSYVIGNMLKSGTIGKEDMVTIGNDAWATGNPIFKGSSLMFLKPGDRVSVSTLSHGINLQSGNDACVAMAEYVAGSQDAFVNLMNTYVHKLGLQNTTFKTVHGLDAHGQYTSARDIAMIGQALIRDVPDEYSMYQEKEFTFNNIRQMNRNGLLWDESLNVDGIKTGHTNTAGYNLVASATEGKMRLISSVLGCSTYKACETESKKLLRWGFRFFETVGPLKVGTELTSEPVWFGNTKRVGLGVDQDIYLTVPRGAMKSIKAKYVLNRQEIHAPIEKHQVLGYIKFQLDGKILDKHPLVAINDVKESGLFSRILDSIKLIFHRWFG